MKVSLYNTVKSTEKHDISIDDYCEMILKGKANFIYKGKTYIK